jgi:hypothetical protein
MSDYDPDDYADDGPDDDYTVEKKIKYINVDKHKDLLDRIKDKIISLQDEIISGINGTRAVQELDIVRYKAMVDVLKAMIQ